MHRDGCSHLIKDLRSWCQTSSEGEGAMKLGTMKRLPKSLIRWSRIEIVVRICFNDPGPSFIGYPYTLPDKINDTPYFLILFVLLLTFDLIFVLQLYLRLVNLL